MKIKLIILALLSVFVLTACDDTEEPIEHTEVTSQLETTFSISEDAFTLEEETILPNIMEGAILTWSSESPLLDTTNTLSLPEEGEETITVTVEIKKNGAVQSKTYSVTLIAETVDIVDGDFRIIDDQRVADGALVISGGNSSSNLQQIDDTFVGLGGGNDHIQILIVPTSSGGPTASAVNSMKNSYMSRYGLSEDQFRVLNVTTTTKELADDPSEVAKVQGATAIWFTGGDQYRVTSSLWHDDGTPSLVLQAIFDAWEDGNIVIGGSSAGAAIMSSVMIGGGLSIGALAYNHVELRTSYTGDLYEFGALQVNDTGFGFFDVGVIDQHFNTRDRIGRLLEATYVEGNKGIGFGVGENSALIYDKTAQTISVIGEITIIDTTDATRSKTVTNLSKYENVKLSVLRGSSIYNITTKEITFLRDDGRPMDNITTAPGNQFLYPTNISSFGLDAGNIHEFIGLYLLDNRKDYMYTGRDGLPYISHFTIADHQLYRDNNQTTDRIIIEKRLYFDAASTLAYYDATLREYAYHNVILDIIPLEDNFTEQQ